MALALDQHSGPAARADALEEALARLRPSYLPAGRWLLTDPAQPGWQLEVTVDEVGPKRIVLLDTPRLVGQLGKVALVTASWLWSQGDDPPAFGWPDLGRVFGHPHPNSELIGYMRLALGQLTRHNVRREAINLRAAGGPARWPVETTGAWFEAVAIQQPGSGSPAPGRKPNRVRPDRDFSPQVAAGAWSSVPPHQLLTASSQLLRRLWLYATAATLRPAGADGVVRVPLAIDPLLEVLGVTDSRLDRARRRLAAAVSELAESDRRFAGSADIGDGHIALVRDRPLRA